MPEPGVERCQRPTLWMDFRQGSPVSGRVAEPLRSNSSRGGTLGSGVFACVVPLGGGWRRAAHFWRELGREPLRLRFHAHAR